MKLTKLSLAAIVAVGALGSFASATPLEEAIKGVDVSGFMRLRYYQDSDTFGTRTANPADATEKNHEAIRPSGLFVVKAPVTDSLKFVTALATNGYNFPDTSSSAATSPVFNKFFFSYAANGLTVNAGKFEIPTPWTEAGFGGTRGNGVLALYSPAGLGWTFAGAAYLQTDSWELASSVTALSANTALSKAALGDAGKYNLYALAAIGKAGPVDLQFWLASMEKVIDYTFFAEAKFAMAGFNARGQVNYLMPNKDFLDMDGSLFAGLEGGYMGKFNNGGWNVGAGLTWSNDPDITTRGTGSVTGAAGASLYALDNDADGFIKFGKQLYYKTWNQADNLVAFVKGGVNVDKFGAEAGFGYAKFGYDGIVGSEIKDDDVGYEAYLNLSYKYAKNFGLELYYSALMGDYFKKTTGDKNNELRFQAQYNF